MGGFSLLDPPGPSPMSLTIVSAEKQPLYTFVILGRPALRPVVATVPIAFKGLGPKSIPRLFAAEVDPQTGRPRVVTGPGGCFVATTTRINNPKTGMILPAYSFSGSTFRSEILTFHRNRSRRK